LSDLRSGWLTSRKYSRYLFLLEAESNPEPECDLISMNNPLTELGIGPATFRLVAQHLKHCATAVTLTYVLFRKCTCVWCNYRMNATIRRQGMINFKIII